MIEQKQFEQLRALRAPNAAAVAGILFGVLFLTGLLLIRSAIPENLTVDSAWLAQDASRIRVAVVLTQFAGIAFLWFIYATIRLPMKPFSRHWQR